MTKEKLSLTARFLILIYAGFCLPLFAQSGRTTPSPTPAPQTLVLPESKKEFPPCDEGSGEVVIIRSLELAKLADELNKFGNCGYRVEMIFRRSIATAEDRVGQAKFALYLKRDKTNKYEYAWFLARRPGEAQTLANDAAEKGFYFKKVMTFIEGACSEETQRSDQKNKESGGVLGVLSTFGVDASAIFLFERKAGSLKKNEYRILDGSTGTAPGKVYEKILADYVAKGFRPVGLWWLGFSQRHFVVAEKDEEIKPAGEYIYSDIALGTDKALTKFARAGYRLIITSSDFSILHRANREPLEIEYKAVPFHKELMKKFPGFLGKGIVDVQAAAEYNGCDMLESEWFFISPTEKSRNGFQSNKEYKLLTFIDFSDKYAKEKGWLPGKKTRFTDEQYEELQSAYIDKVYETIKEGYEIKIFSPANGFSVLFERRPAAGLRFE